MNKRIQAISLYINSDDIVADIGCDQALLSEILAKKGMNSSACDIKENIVLNASERLKKLKLDKYVSFIVSDGIKNIPDNIDTLVLAGMGTYTILSILSFSNKKYKKVITISNNNHQILRENMIELGYKVKSEEIIIERDKYYNLIVFEPGTVSYSNEELIVGINHLNKLNLNKKLLEDLKKYKKIYKITKENLVLEKINIIEAYVK